MKKLVPGLLLVSVHALSSAVAHAGDEPAASDDTQTAAIVIAVPEETPDTRLSRVGLGSLYGCLCRPRGEVRPCFECTERPNRLSMTLRR